MSPVDREAVLDQNFERTLIESAGTDALPAAGTSAAWDRFAAALAGTTALAKPAVARAGAAADSGRLGGRGVAIKWLVIGAIGGSALTAVVMTAQRERSPSVARQAAPQARAASAPAASHEEGSPVLPSIGPALPAPPAIAPPPARVAKVPSRANREDRGLRPAVAATDTTTHAAALAAEVSLLDAALRANAAGAYDDALHVLRDYHQRFPEGELSIDADVIALDALAGKHDDARVATDGARFLTRYPNDPHAAHVKTLIDERSP